MKEYAILLDSTYCTGCNTCSYRCVQEFREHDRAAHGLFKTFVQTNDEGMNHTRCMQCKDPQCAKACPSGALTKSEYGPVLYDSEKCSGAKRCVEACPFHVPQFDAATNKIVKCSMCAHRVSQGKQPACVEVCPSGALQFGQYSEMAEFAKTTALKSRLNIYGLEENGGTHLIILTRGEPENVGYPRVSKK